MMTKTIQWLASSVGLTALALAVVAAPMQSAGAAATPAPPVTNTCQPSGTATPTNTCACASGYCSDGSTNWTCPAPTLKEVKNPDGTSKVVCACGPCAV